MGKVSCLTLGYRCYKRVDGIKAGACTIRVFTPVLLLVLICMLFVRPSLGLAVDIHVPGDYDTIQQAIDAAEDENTILVGPGTYDRIDYNGKCLYIYGVQGAAYTTINGKQQGTVVDMSDISTSGAILSGFTITGGIGELDVGIRCGGGVYAAGSNQVAIMKNVIRNNTAFYGGGIYFNQGISNVRQNIIENNTAENGGGMAIRFDADISLIGNVFRQNQAQSSGDSAVGGGVYVENVGPFFYNNLFDGNSAQGGVATILTFGGAICSLTAGSTIFNCTFVNNSVSTGTWVRGGAVYFGGVNKYPLVRNSIFWDNTNSGADNSIDVGYSVGSTETTVHGGIEYTLLPANTVGVNSTSDISWGSGILNSAPIFATGTDGSYYLSQTGAGQSQDSPAVDAGYDTSANTCGPIIGYCLDQMHTRTDQVIDTGTVDLGYHYWESINGSPQPSSAPIGPMMLLLDD